MNWDNLNSLNIRRLKLAKQWMSTGTHHGRLCTAAGRGNVREGLCATHVSAAKPKRKTEASETLGVKHKEAEDISRQPLVVFDALAPSDPQTHGCESLTKHTHTHKQIQMARGRMDPGTSFRLDALIPQPVLPHSAHRPFQAGHSSEWPTLTLTLCGRGT